MSEEVISSPDSSVDSGVVLTSLEEELLRELPGDNWKAYSGDSRIVSSRRLVLADVSRTFVGDVVSYKRVRVIWQMLAVRDSFPGDMERIKLSLDVITYNKSTSSEDKLLANCFNNLMFAAKRATDGSFYVPVSADESVDSLVLCTPFPFVIHTTRVLYGAIGKV